MRVIIVNDYATVNGGASKVALLSAKALAERGVEVHFVSGSNEIEDTYQNVPNLTFHTLNRNDQTMGSRQLVAVAYLKDCYQLVSNLIKQGKPSNTIVHLHCWKTGVSPSALNATESSGVKFVVTFHDYHVACPQGQFFNKRTNQICHLSPCGARCISTHCTDTRTIIPKWAEVYRHKIQVNKAGLPTRLKHAILLSDGCEKIIKPYLAPECKIYKVDNPIEVTRLPRIDVSKNKTILFSGRLSAEKDPMTLLLACRNLGLPVKFIGDGPQLSELKSLKYEKATFTGWITGERIQNEMEQARIFVLPSIWYEVRPLAPLEAMGRGIPVIASACTTTVSEFEEGVSGLSFRPGDVESLSEQLLKLQVDDEADKMGNATYSQFWDNPPTLNNHIDQLVGTYQTILSSN